MNGTAKEPPWVEEGRKWIGLAEIPGKENSPVISRWLLNMRAWWSDDDTPWCGVYQDHCMRTAGAMPPRASYRAAAWLDWGIELERPLIGAVAVFERKGGNHVGMVVGRVPGVGLSVLGGNQGNQVSIAVFSRAPVGLRWPREFAYMMVDHDRALPIVPAMRSRSAA